MTVSKSIFSEVQPGAVRPTMPRLSWALHAGAFFLIWRFQTYQSLLSLAHLEDGFLWGLPLAIATYILSLCFFVSLQWPQLHFAFDPRILLARGDGGKIASYLLRSIYEEMFWRATLQVLMGNSAIAVALVATGFTLKHYFIYKRRARLSDLIEFFAFSMVLGIVFMMTGNLWITVSIHFIRNVSSHLITRCLTIDPR
jgi:membrane protease YdiL (CAAX protease family)